MGSPPKQVQSDIAAFKGADLVKIWLAPTALERIKLRDRYTEEYNPKAYLRELRALPEHAEVGGSAIFIAAWSLQASAPATVCGRQAYFC